MKTEISILIPFLNESPTIPALLKGLDAFTEASKYSVEIIFINDGSTDNSLALIQNHVFQKAEARTINLSRNFGSHAALRAGITLAKGSYIVFMYADLQDPLDLITLLYESARDRNLSIVWGERTSSEIGLFERFFSKLYSRLMRAFVSPHFPENGMDVVLFDQKVAEELRKNEESNSSLFIQILLLGFSQGTVRYSKQARKEGRSKWTVSKKIRLVIDSFVAFSFAPIRFVSITGISFFIIGMIWTAYIITRELLYHDLTAGWPTLISILLLGFGITNISLGIIAEYLWRTLDTSRKRPVYIVESVLEPGSPEPK